MKNQENKIFSIRRPGELRRYRGRSDDPGVIPQHHRLRRRRRHSATRRRPRARGARQHQNARAPEVLLPLQRDRKSVV